MSLNSHYEVVLEDLRQTKADAEDGIRAILRLMSRASAVPSPGSEPPPSRESPSSLTNRIIAFLESQHGKTFRAEDISKAIESDNMKTLRATLFRLAKSGKIGRHGRGKYRNARKAANAEATTA